MKSILFVLTLLSALSVPSAVRAESCFAEIGGKRISLGTMCGDTQTSQPDKTGFLRELRKAVASNDIASRMVASNPQSHVDRGLRYCQSRKRFSAQHLAGLREQVLASQSASDETKLLMRATDRLAETYLCR